MSRRFVGVSDAYFRRDRTDGWTYFIHAEGTDLYKIGSTLTDPKDRLKSLQTSSPHKLRLVAAIRGIHREALWHEKLAHCRRQGEWFESPWIGEVARAMQAADKQGRWLYQEAK